MIVGKACSAYLGAMFAAALRLLALIALVVMPLGMTAAPVAAAPAADAIAASQVGHCDDHQEPADSPLKAKVHCTGCAALVAPAASSEAAELRPQAPTQIRLSYFGTAFEPEIATPPPKFA